jgi:hypothetical protein
VESLVWDYLPDFYECHLFNSCNIVLLLRAGTDYYRLNEFAVDDGYPRSIQEDWDVQGPIDAALHWDNGYTFIFKVKMIGLCLTLSLPKSQLYDS